MQLLETLKERIAVDGSKSVSEALGIPQGLLSQFARGSKKPGLDTCQKIMDLWGKSAELTPMQIAQQPDGSECKTTLETEINGDVIFNASYVPAEWGTKKEMWKGRDVCLCIPAYKNIPEVCAFSFMALVMKYRQAIRLEWRGGDSMITRSRNHLAKRFLDGGATWSIWLDTDMVFPFGHAGIFMTVTNMRNVASEFLSAHVIERLISWDRKVVGGCYWDRRGGGRLIAGGSEPILHPIPSNTLQAVAFVGTGCLAVHRQVFLDIAAKFPETLSPDSLGNECGFFTNIQTPQRMLGEDESFAKRATDAGHPTFLDLGLINGHVGEAMVHGIPAGGSKI